MTDFEERYKDFLVGLKEKSLLKLETTKKYKYDDLALFLLSLKTAPSGFVENYCLDENVKKRLEEIRNKIDSDSTWTKEVIKKIEKYLPIPYKMFMYLSWSEQMDTIKGIKNNLNDREKEEFNKKFEDLLDRKEENKNIKNSSFIDDRLFAINYRCLIGNIFYIKQENFIKYEDITEYKKVLYKTLNEKYEYIMFKFEDGDYDFIEINGCIFIKESEGVRCMGEITDKLLSINNIYPKEIHELIDESRNRFVEKNKQLIKK